MELIIVFFLIILNGILALSEIAIVSSRKSRLALMAREGSAGAQKALELTNNPNQFLSTIQIGITLIGILAGAYSGATLAPYLAFYFQNIPFIKLYSEGIALGIVVTIITFLSLLIGELVPKRIALNNPEKIAALISSPMQFLSKVTGPLVYLLGISTDALLKLLHINPRQKEDVSEEEVKMLIREGTRTGVFDVAEKDIVERTFRLADKRVNTLMISRKEIKWIDIESPFTTIKNIILKYRYSHFPVCKGSIDKVIGVIHTEDLLLDYVSNKNATIAQHLHKPLLVPAHTDALHLLELFKKSGIHMAIIIDEYGAVLGLVSLTDILEEIVGDIPKVDDLEDKEVIKRDDGSYLIDGLLSIDDFKEKFHFKKLPGEKSGSFHTAGGFAMNRLGKIPHPGDFFEWEGMRLEVVDMDNNRVDKILIKPSIIVK